MVEEEMKPKEAEEENGENDTEIEKSGKDVQATTLAEIAATAKRHGKNLKDVLMNFFIVELKVKGLSDGVNSKEDRLNIKFFRLDAKQRNTIAYWKVEFYRTLKNASNFKLDGKYVVPKKKLNKIHTKFQEIEGKFYPFRDELFNTLTSNWDEIIAQFHKDYPELEVDEEKLEKLRPTDADTYLDIEFQLSPLTGKFGELEALTELFSSGTLDDKQIAERVNKMKGTMFGDLRKQYEKKILQLEKESERLKRSLTRKRTAEFKSKLWSTTNDLAEDVENMGEILGDDSITVKLEAMKELLMETSEFKPVDPTEDVETPETPPEFELPEDDDPDKPEPDDLPPPDDTADHQ